MNRASIAQIAAIAIAIAFALGACAVLEPQKPSDVSEGVRDFIVVSELPEVDQISTRREKTIYYVSDDYIVMARRGEAYLVEFRSACHNLGDKPLSPEMFDVRRDPNVIRAGYDTVRGCWIEKIYKLQDEQASEVFGLGRPPTAEVFASEDDES